MFVIPSLSDVTFEMHLVAVLPDLLPTHVAVDPFMGVFGLDTTVQIVHVTSHLQSEANVTHTAHVDDEVHVRFGHGEFVEHGDEAVRV